MKSLKYVIAFTLCVLSWSSFASSQCQGLKGCERKFCEIERQLEIAKRHHNTYRISGLEDALRHAKANCSPEGLKQELSKKIKETQDDIAEYQDDLKKAEQKNDTDKVRKYQRKIQEERTKLEDLLEEQRTL